MIRTYDYDGENYDIVCKLDVILNGMVQMQTIAATLKDALMRLICLGAERYDEDDNLEDIRQGIAEIEKMAFSVVQDAYWIAAGIPKEKESEEKDGSEEE